MKEFTNIIIRLPFLLLALALLMVHLVPLGAADAPDLAEPVETVARVTTVGTVKAPARVEAADTVRRCDNGYIYSDDIPLSDGWQCWMQQCCYKYDVPYALALGMAETESSFQWEADSGWAYGLMQIGYINHDWLTERGMDPMTKQGNIEAGVYMIGDLLTRYGDPHKALMAYNCGESGAAELWATGETESDYSRAVLTAAERWEKILGGQYG